MATVTIDPNTSHQTILAFQASAETGINDYVGTGPNWNDAMLDVNVDLGINQVRIGLMSGLVENTTDYYQLFIDNGEDFVDNNTPTEYADVRNNRRVPVNDNGDSNSINAAGFQWGYVDWQMDNIVVPMKSKLAARGETLRWGVSYVHFSATDQLHIDTPAEYGEFILAVWNHLESTYGFVPDFLEIFLEPDGVAAVTASEMAAMIVAARDRLVGAGYAKPYIVAPCTTSGPNGRAMYLNIKTANATAASYIDGIGYHLYVAMNSTQRGDLAATAAADSKNTEMTEYGGGTIADLHEDLKTSKVSVWELYALGYTTVGGVTDNGYQYFLVGAGPSYTITEGNRTKYLRHYMQFIRAGAVMKGVTVSGTGSSNADALVFMNPNGRIIVVVKCAAAVDLALAGLPVDGVTMKVKYTTGNGTSAPSAYFQDLSDQVVSGGATGTVSMPGAGVLTFFDEEYLTPPSVSGAPRVKRMLMF